MDSRIQTDQTEKNLDSKIKKREITEELVNYDSKGNSIFPINFSSENNQESSFGKFENDIKKFLEDKNLNISQNL